MKKQEEELVRMTFLEHLAELRRRIIVWVVSFIIATLFSFFYREKLFRLILEPLYRAVPDSQKLMHFTNLIEPFVAYIKVSLIGGIVLSAPILIYEIWAFVAPGLYKKERIYGYFLLIFGSLLFIGGALFGFFVVFPYGFHFLLSFASEDMQQILTVREYLAFSTKLLLAFGIVFELPLFVLLLNLAGIVETKTLKNARRYVIIACFVVAAVLTPPDVVTQISLALPLIILYEISIWIGVMFERIKRIYD